MQQIFLAWQVMDESVKRAMSPLMRAFRVVPLPFQVPIYICVFHPRPHIVTPFVPPRSPTRAIAAKDCYQGIRRPHIPVTTLQRCGYVIWFDMNLVTRFLYSDRFRFCVFGSALYTSCFLVKDLHFWGLTFHMLDSFQISHLPFGSESPHSSGQLFLPAPTRSEYVAQ